MGTEKMPRMSRSELLRNLAPKAALVAAGVLMVDGTDPIGALASIEPRRSNNPVRLVVGDHHTDDQHSAVDAPYANTGNLCVSFWNEPPLSIIDTSMRTAQKRGEPYYLVVDSVQVTQINQLPSLPWTLLPHPNLYERNHYPEIHIIGAEPLSNFGLDTVPIPATDTEATTQLAQLIQNVMAPFDSTSHQINQEISDNDLQILERDAVEALVAGGLIGASIMGKAKMTRKKVLEIIAAAGGTVALKTLEFLGHTEKLETFAGQVNNPEQQQLVINLIGVLPREDLPLELIAWSKARTALGIEKVMYAYELAHEGSPPATLDALYGSTHAEGASRIINDSAYRMDTIKEFTRLLLHGIDSKIKNGYPALAPYREQLLFAAAFSLLGVTDYTFIPPWGKKFVPTQTGQVTPDDIDIFERGLVKESVTRTCEPIRQQAINPLLKEFDIDPQNPSPTQYL